MSSPLAISGVTGVLQSMLNQVYTGAGLGTVSVSAVAPDIIQSNLSSNFEAQQVNLFLHQVTPNAAWRNVGLPSLAADGSTRLSNPQLALDLHYLLTVYAGLDCRAEALLGHAVLMLFEYPVLSRNQIRTFLTGLAPDPLSTSGLGDQIEMIKITPATLGREEIAWIWTALKADYRPTFPFQVSVVLIQPQNALSSPLPVLRRAVSVQPNLYSPLPTLTDVAPPSGQPAGSLGDTITVTGENLSGTTGIVLINSRLGIKQTLGLSAAAGNASVQFVLPNPPLPPPQPNPTDLPGGVYLLSAEATGGVLSNGLPLAIAPQITSPLLATLASGPSVSLTITCTPYLRPGQQVSLLIGGQEAPVVPFTAPTNSPSFTFQNLEATGGPVPVRLRVDGIDSPIIDWTKTPPVYSGPLIQVS
jgi:hypothetical protein